MSTVHAIFITYMSVYLVFFSHLFSDQLDGPITLRSSNLSNFTLGVKDLTILFPFELSMLTCIFLFHHIRLILIFQVSVGYFITDIAMIFWVYPSLGGMEYVSDHMWPFLFLPFKYLLAFWLASLTHLLLMIFSVQPLLLHFCTYYSLLVNHYQVLHHILSLISIVYATYSGEGQLYTYMVLISEATTPGINLRWYIWFY